MKKVAILVLLLAVAAVVAIPMMGSAANCRNASPQPTPQSGSTVNDLPDGGKVWVHPSGSQAGVKGPNGYLVVQQNGSSVDVYGHQAQTTGVNGSVHLDSANPSTICIDTNGS